MPRDAYDTKSLHTLTELSWNVTNVLCLHHPSQRYSCILLEMNGQSRNSCIHNTQISSIPTKKPVFLNFGIFYAYLNDFWLLSFFDVFSIQIRFAICWLGHFLELEPEIEKNSFGYFSRHPVTSLFSFSLFSYTREIVWIPTCTWLRRKMRAKFWCASDQIVEYSDRRFYLSIILFLHQIVIKQTGFSVSCISVNWDHKKSHFSPPPSSLCFYFSALRRKSGLHMEMMFAI